MFQILFDTVKFYNMCFICYEVFHILLSWDSLWIYGMYVYVCMYVSPVSPWLQNGLRQNVLC